MIAALAFARAHALLLGVAAGVGLLVALLTMAYGAGAAAARNEAALARAGDTIAAADANQSTATAVRNATDRLAGANERLQQEAAHAVRSINQFRPPAGALAIDAKIDSALASSVLCHIERLRGDTEGPACLDAARRIVGGAP